ncbi:hypothetical protein ACP0HM_34675 [Escherichia coli]
MEIQYDLGSGYRHDL